MDDAKPAITKNDPKTDPVVIVYSTPTCPYCSRAKEYLKSKGVKFEDYNVAADQARADEMITKSGQSGVPVLEINHRIIIGFDKNLINDALSRRAPMKREDVIKNAMIFDPFLK
jgi:glutaredoxin 3